MKRQKSVRLSSVLVSLLAIGMAMPATAAEEVLLSDYENLSDSTVTVTTVTKSADWDFCVGSFNVDRNDDDENDDRQNVTFGLAANLDLGWSATLGAPEEGGYKVRRNLDVTFELAQVRYRTANKRNTFSFGLGWNWKRYGSRVCTTVENKTVKYGEYPTGATNAKTKLAFRYFMFPVSYNHKFSHNQQLGFSVIPQLLLKSSATNKYKLAGEKEKDSYDTEARQFALDLRLTWYPVDHLGFYLKYSPITTFKSPSPEFNPFGFGFSLQF